MKITELREKYKKEVGMNWNDCLGTYINWLERTLIKPTKKGEILPLATVTWRSEQVLKRKSKAEK